MSDFERRSPGTDARIEPERAPDGGSEPTRLPVGEGGRPALTPSGLLGIQRSAGNRAAAAMLGSARRQPVGEDEDVARAEHTTIGQPPQLATQPVVSGTNPFDYREGDGDEPQVQRFKASAGYKATAVAIESSGHSATGVAALEIKKTATRLRIGSGPNPAYTAVGTVKIGGDKAEVGQYQVGFLQTVFESNRHFHYASVTETPGKGAKKMTDYTKTQPGRDGDTGFVPWYGPETVKDFAAADPDTKSTRMDDTPSSGQVWQKDFGKGMQQLKMTSGRDTFVSWLAVRNKRTKAVTLLNNASWYCDYGADVTVDTATPANSKVTPTTGKVAVTSTGDGKGSKTPLYTDPVANDAAWKTTAW